MSGRVTRHAVSLLSVTAWMVTLGVLSARPDVLIAALPIAVVLAIAVCRRTAPAYALTRHLSTDRAMEGERVTVVVTITAQSALPLVELLDVVPSECEVVSGTPRAVLSVRAGASATIQYDVRLARGVHTFGMTIVRVRDRWALRGWERRHVEAHVVRGYPRVAPVRSVPRPRHTQTSIGDYVSPVLGEGIEPGDIRPFAPGDQVKQVNWRASLRLGALHVTQHHRERNADVVLMLDTLADVGVAPDSALDLGVRVVASLAAAYLARKDRVGLITYGGTIDWVKPGRGRGQYERLVDTLTRATVVFTYVSKDLAFVPPRVLPAHALVLAVSPLLDARFTKATLDLAARGFDVVVLMISPVDVTHSMLAGSRVDELACRLWAVERRTRLDEFRRHGIAAFEWHPAEPLELALGGHNRRRPRSMVVG